MSYSQLMGLLKKNNIDLNRKVLADLAMNEPEVFKSIVEKSKINLTLNFLTRFSLPHSQALTLSRTLNLQLQDLFVLISYT